jgi:RNA:NAD 2'-phosphotransferase (TPT1/KptA family)
MQAVPAAVPPNAAPQGQLGAVTMSHAEQKHWSKAMAAVLRHETPPPHERTLQELMQVMRSSHRYGFVTATKVYAVATHGHRFVLRHVTEPNGWVQWYVRAV